MSSSNMTDSKIILTKAAIQTLPKEWLTINVLESWGKSQMVYVDLNKTPKKYLRLFWVKVKAAA